MAAEISPNHARQIFSFSIPGGSNAEVHADLERVIEDVAHSRAWLLGPPAYACEPDSLEDGEEIKIAGGVLEIYSALPPWTLPTETDRQHLEEVTALVEALRPFSARWHVELEFFLDSTYVGDVADGQMDRSLAETLLGEWRRVLEKREKS